MRRPRYRQVLSAGLACAAAWNTGCAAHQPLRATQPPSYPVRPSTVASGHVKKPSDLPDSPPDSLRIAPDARLLSTEQGLASWYGTVYNQRRGADGTIYDQDAMTAASRTLPLGAIARITNLAGGQAAVVRITDRGPFVPGRILDLSRAAARALGLDRIGVGTVRVEAYAGENFHEVPARWCVQVGAFIDPDDARQAKNDLLLRYPTARVIAFDGPTGSWVRLTLSKPERDPSAAVAAAIHVPDPGVEAYVTRTN